MSVAVALDGLIPPAEVGGSRAAADVAVVQEEEHAEDVVNKKRERTRRGAPSMETSPTSLTTDKRAAGTAAAMSTGSTSARS